MKAISKFILFVAACSTATWFSLSSRAQRLDPATGLPAPTKPGEVSSATGLPAGPSGHVKYDPKTGLPLGLTWDDLGHQTYPVKADESWLIRPQLGELIEELKYDEALQLLLDTHKPLKLNDPLAETLLPDWIELSRRFPKAKAALIEIRDQYQNEFYAGRGYRFLFGQLYAINGQLQQDDATYALFQFIRNKDKKLAEQCFGTVAPLLIKRGEFDLCLSYIGDPQEKLEALQEAYDWTLVHQHHADLLKQQSDHQLAEIRQQLDQTNIVKPVFVPNYYPPPPVPVNPVPSLRAFTEYRFVNEIRQLIEILVGAGREAEAEAIQNKAVAISDDPRLKSAVSDATQQVQYFHSTTH